MPKNLVKLLLLCCQLTLVQLAKHRPKTPFTETGISGTGRCSPNPERRIKFTSSPQFSSCTNGIRQSMARWHYSQGSDMAELLSDSGYPFQLYNVTTNDGYILSVYRISGSPKTTRRKSKGHWHKQAVYLNHGLGGASDCWNFQPGSRNLPFKLADAGYDVWIGNSRGTTYSAKHTRFNGNSDLNYWDFSFHEMGIFDVPAVTEKILSVTRNRKLFYVGHSMGATQYLVSLSEIPEMNHKILAGFLLAPAAHVGHMNSPFRQLVPMLAKESQFGHANAVLKGRVRSAHLFRRYLKISPNDVCDATAVKCRVCDNLMFALFGYDAPQLNTTQVPSILAKYPNYISVKTLAHYAQLVASCKFQKFDYGQHRNRAMYGQSYPPEYNLRNVQAPTYIFYSDYDTFAPSNDVDLIISKLRAGNVLKGSYKVKSKYFNHADFILAKDADKLVYNKILSEMRKFIK